SQGVRSSPRSDDWRLSAEFALVLVGMLLFSERTWKHHCVILVVPFAVLCYYLAVCKPGARLRGCLIGSLAAAALLMATTSTGLLDENFAKQAQVYGAYVLAYVVLACALVAVLRTRGPALTVDLSLPLAA